jgi:polar amino acid transport system permease protein
VLIWGLVLALARVFPGKAGRPVRFLAVAYIDLFRGFPAIITIYLIVLGFQAGDVPPFNQLEGETKLFWLCTTSLVLVYGAYVAEVYRAGLESIHWSQTAAARSLGLSFLQTQRFVVVPQAVRRIIPPLLNDFIGLQKDTALGVVGLLEASTGPVYVQPVVQSVTEPGRRRRSSCCSPSRWPLHRLPGGAPGRKAGGG